MHPAFSIIFFTTAAGAGYGLLILMGLFGPLGLLPSSGGFGFAGFALGLGLVTLGLAASTLHLSHPERAWRAFSQWRSSWLSREGVASVITYVPAAVFAVGWVFFSATGGLMGVAGWLMAAMAVVTVYCTAMIYASLKPIHQWHNGWVPLNYLALALMSGALLLNAITHLFGAGRPWLGLLTLAATAVAWALKEGYWRFIATTRAASTPETATGLGHLGRVRLLEAPHTEANYLLKEMGYQVGRKHAARLRTIARIAGFGLPLLLTAAAMQAGTGAAGAAATVAAALGAALGLIAERWLFFAEAKHTVNLYYGAQSV
ncbi:MAG TPA: DmsC/YnfH family molybdoenzyme membrane anchor subunit [Azospirillaceae bacterium]|nr:DmsC/YnfH family molybdoenzyme membrane anchor subunit [Azospirillaceae bacterium]